MVLTVRSPMSKSKHRVFARHVHSQYSLFVSPHKNTQNMSLLVPSVDYIPLATTTQFSVRNFLHWVANWEAACVSTDGHGESRQKHRLPWLGGSCGSPSVRAEHCHLLPKPSSSSFIAHSIIDTSQSDVLAELCIEQEHITSFTVI